MGTFFEVKVFEVVCSEEEHEDVEVQVWRTPRAAVFGMEASRWTGSCRLNALEDGRFFCIP